MKVFVSWSGEVSKRLAEALARWLPDALQFVEAYFSPSDVEKGSKWDTEIAAALNETRVCVIALTRENLTSKWILFEAGAISRSVGDKSRVCPILFGLEPTEVEYPLASFQLTKFSKDDIYKLMKTINANAERGLEATQLERIFEKWWPELEVAINGILKEAPAASGTSRQERDLLEETVQIVRIILGQTNQIAEVVNRWSYTSQAPSTAQPLYRTPILDDPVHPPSVTSKSGS
jgi:hypothetical protein